MDMQDYNDPNESTTTCYKLECGHAYHTRCIVTFLTKTQHKCPLCNKHKTPDEQISREGVIRKAIDEIKKTEEFRVSKNEYIAARDEYLDVLKSFKADVKKYLYAKAVEFRIKDHRDYYRKALSNVLVTTKKIAVTFGFKHIGAVWAEDHTRRRYGVSFAKSIILGDGYYKDRWRLENPRFWCSMNKIFNNK
jgi:hypothetical protein